MGSSIRRATAAEREPFDHRMVEEVFAVSECAFDWMRLRDFLAARIKDSGIPVRLAAEVTRIGRTSAGDPEVSLADGERLSAGAVFNVTYAALNAVLKASGLNPYPIKYEFAEVALMDPPEGLSGLGVTVMDGPFFSTMPFPSERAYSLTHVRYTPHFAWTDEPGCPDAYQVASAVERHSRWRQMVADGARFVPSLSGARWRRSLYEVKAVMIRNENDDGRPIQLIEHTQLAGLYSVLGGKIDNIFDLYALLPSIRLEWEGLSQKLLLA
jgi:glycine/D-amino acid oxidase-like deaminating enzyme